MEEDPDPERWSRLVEEEEQEKEKKAARLIRFGTNPE